MLNPQANDTHRRLEAMTDSGLFERLATAVLRVADSRTRRLVHSGVNVEGKTVNSPVDGITFLGDANPPQMIAVHHTTCKREDLRRKWLNEPDSLTACKIYGSRPSEGDLIKAIRLFLEQKRTIPNLQATIILTTNKEPLQDLIQELHTVAQSASVEVEIWSNSSIAHILDFNATGQWIRRKYLQIEQEYLSFELLRELSKTSLSYTPLFHDTRTWIGRDLDDALASASGRDVMFLVGESGTGKSVACYRRLAKHIDSGGLGLIVSHDVLVNSLSLDQAIHSTLQSLHPALVSGSGSMALELAAHSRRLLIVVVEDVSRSPQPQLLIERLASWSTRNEKPQNSNSWQILCPLWPRLLLTLRDDIRKNLGQLIQTTSGYTEKEGTAAVQMRRTVAGVQTTDLDAATVAAALGNDPLLIALSDPFEEREPRRVIQGFVQSSIERLAEMRREFTTGEYLATLRQFAYASLECRCLNPSMVDISRMFDQSQESITMLRHVVQNGELMHVAGKGTYETVVFRHDRVRDWLCADALVEEIQFGTISDSVLGDPYYAEIIGAALARVNLVSRVLERVSLVNPLALFCAMFYCDEQELARLDCIVKHAEAWLKKPETQRPNMDSLRWEATRVLSQCNGSYVRSLASRFPNETDEFWGLRARFRNGDFLAGIVLCCRYAPGVTVVGHVELIDHVYGLRGVSLLRTLKQLLRRPSLPQQVRSGGLRLSGYLRDPSLADAIESCWKTDENRNAILADYLWAAAQCCGDNPARLLGSVCDCWATLSDESEDGGMPSARDNLAAHEVRWAFRERVPKCAVRYFVDRAQPSDLRWPITYMLHGLDDPSAIEFVVSELARMDLEHEGRSTVPVFISTVRDEWNWQQEKNGKSMSGDSRTFLYRLWSDTKADRHFRTRAFEIWCSTVASDDISTLAKIEESDVLADPALFQLLRRGDQNSIERLVRKLRNDGRGYWWQLGRFIWSDKLTEALDGALQKRGEEIRLDKEPDERAWIDHILAERLMALPIGTTERLLTQHWMNLSRKSEYLQVALYVASSKLCKMVADIVKTYPVPKDIFEHITMHFGVRIKGRSGITRPAQIEALRPYFCHLSNFDIQELWQVCGKNGWKDFRRQHLDARVLSHETTLFVDDTRAMVELDRLVDQSPIRFTNHWIDRSLETGESTGSMMAVVREWLGRKDDIGSLVVASEVVKEAGRRCDKEILLSHKMAMTDEGRSIIDDTSFFLKRRTLR